MDELEGHEVDQAAAQQAAESRRRHQRYPVEGWAEVMTMDGTMMVRGQLTDISAAGCYVESHGVFDLPMNGGVELTLRIRGVEFRPEAVTRVVKTGHGAGFAFVRLNSKVAGQIQALIDVLREVNEAMEKPAPA
jgi:hypothetical protein